MIERHRLRPRLPILTSIMFTLSPACRINDCQHFLGERTHIVSHQFTINSIYFVTSRPCHFVTLRGFLQELCAKATSRNTRQKTEPLYYNNHITKVYTNIILNYLNFQLIVSYSLRLNHKPYVMYFTKYYPDRTFPPQSNSTRQNQICSLIHFDKIC